MNYVWIDAANDLLLLMLNILHAKTIIIIIKWQMTLNIKSLQFQPATRLHVIYMQMWQDSCLEKFLGKYNVKKNDRVLFSSGIMMIK